jgi:hypothetical protein
MDLAAADLSSRSSLSMSLVLGRRCDLSLSVALGLENLDEVDDRREW